MKKSGLESKDGAVVSDAHCSDITAPAHFTEPEVLHAELIQIIGSTIILYRKNLKEPKIKLPR